MLLKSSTQTHLQCSCSQHLSQSVVIASQTGLPATSFASLIAILHPVIRMLSLESTSTLSVTWKIKSRFPIQPHLSVILPLMLQQVYLFPEHTRTFHTSLPCSWSFLCLSASLSFMSVCHLLIHLMCYSLHEALPDHSTFHSTFLHTLRLSMCLPLLL